MIKEKNKYLANEQTFEDWFDTIPAGLIVINGEGMIEKYNQVAAEIFIQMKKNDSWSDVIKNNIEEIICNGYYIKCHSGKNILFKTQSLPNKKGQLVLLLDETALQNNNETEIKLQKLQSIEKLSATLAHQLRTPLSTAILYASNLNAKNVTADEINEYQIKVLEQLTLIKDHIDEVLLTTKNNVELINKVDIKSEIFSLTNTFNELYSEVIFKINISEHDNYHYCVLGNKNALRGAFSNIIHNAIEASIDDKIIQINFTHYLDAICIEITDFGIGIKNKYLEKILEPYFTTKKTGTGIGLTIAKSIIEAHQGRIDIKSEENNFTKISVTFPAIVCA